MQLKDDTLVLLGWVCPYCGRPAQLVDDREIYGRSYGGKCYVCRPCGAWVGCHKGSSRALGRLADANLRRLKLEAHEAFDPIWREGHISRTQAYDLMSSFFHLPPEQTHIGMFDEQMCREVIAFSNQVLKNYNHG